MTDTSQLDEMIFGVDYDAEEIIFCSGRRSPVESWRDPLGFECRPYDARIAMFRGPNGLPFALDIYSCHFSRRTH